MSKPNDNKSPTSSNCLQLPTTNNLQLPKTIPQPTTMSQILATTIGSTAGALPPQKLNTGGSATGNPRNKCALKPGHSLMDWIRLGNSGVDLSGTGGRVMPVSVEELARHNKREDAWLAIRGKVYNVTRYMDFHPGGIYELMRGVGRDATKLFDEVHAWVNYQQLLAKCLIGPLRVVNKMSTITEGKSSTFTKTPLPPATGGKSSSITATTTEIVPRLDWIQKRHELSIYIYTRQLCNPGLLMKRKNAKALQLKVQIEHNRHLFEFELYDEVVWPPSRVSVTSETGKIEVMLAKVEPALWTTYGAHTTMKIAQLDDTDCVPELEAVHEEEPLHEYEVISCKDFNHDSFELCLQPKQDMLMLLPVGYHVQVAAMIDGDLVRRSYTPFSCNFFQPKASATAANPSQLSFLIKSCNAGLLSKHLRTLEIGEILRLSTPRGSLRLQRLLPHRQIALIAAGSGLTPMLSLIEHLLRRNANRIDYLRLLYFNKTPADIWYRHELERLATTDERFQLVNVLSEADDGEWTGLRGRIRNDLLAPLMAKDAPEHASFVAICGPSAFSQATEDILKALKFDMENLYVFQG